MSKKQDKRDVQAIASLLDDEDCHIQTTGRSVLPLTQKQSHTGDTLIVLEGDDFDYGRKQVPVPVSYLLKNVCNIQFSNGKPSLVQWVNDAKSAREAVVHHLISESAWYEWIPMVFDKNVSFDFDAFEENICWGGKCGAYIDQCKLRFKISLCADDFKRPNGTAFILIQTVNDPCVHVKHKNYGFSSKKSKIDAAISDTVTNQYHVLQSMSDIVIQTGNRQVCFVRKSLNTNHKNATWVDLLVLCCLE